MDFDNETFENEDVIDETVTNETSTPEIDTQNHDLTYWKQLAQDAIAANVTARKDIENLKHELKRMEYLERVYNLQNENKALRTKQELPTVQEMLRGVSTGAYDMTISISLFGGDKRGKTCGCGREYDDE